MSHNDASRGQPHALSLAKLDQCRSVDAHAVLAAALGGFAPTPECKGFSPRWRHKWCLNRKRHNLAGRMLTPCCRVGVLRGRPRSKANHWSRKNSVETSSLVKFVIVARIIPMIR